LMDTKFGGFIKAEVGQSGLLHPMQILP
jgi:predicted RNA-binding protein with RPS1 domain